MFGLKKKNKVIDLEKGKVIFLRYGGNRFHIVREMGREYDECNVPKEMEQEWLSEIKADLEDSIRKSSGNKKFAYVVNLLDISELQDNLNLLFYLLREGNLDTFSTVLYCELLQRERKYIQDAASYDKKKYEQNRPFITKINTTVRSCAQKLLAQPITIDDSYKNASHMRTYDFSDENIKKRINHLLA